MLLPLTVVTQINLLKVKVIKRNIIAPMKIPFLALYFLLINGKPTFYKDFLSLLYSLTLTEKEIPSLQGTMFQYV